MLAALTLYARNVVSGWTTQIALYGVAGALLLFGAIYLVVAAHLYLARFVGLEAAGLLIAGFFLLCGLITLVVTKLRAGRSTRGRNVAALALASSTIPKLLRTSPRLLGDASTGLVRPALAIGGAGLLLIGRLVRRTQAGAGSTPRDIENEPLSTGEAMGALAAAVGRSTRQAARDAGHRWREFEPQVSARIERLAEGLPATIAAAPQSLVELLFPRRRTWPLPWRRRESLLERTYAAVPDTKHNLAIAVSLIGAAVITSYLVRKS